MLVEFREEVKRTKTGMSKRWEETNYPADQLETLDSNFRPLNETPDTSSEGSKEMELSLIHIYNLISVLSLSLHFGVFTLSFCTSQMFLFFKCF